MRAESTRLSEARTCARAAGAIHYSNATGVLPATGGRRDDEGEARWVQGPHVSEVEMGKGRGLSRGSNLGQWHPMTK